MPKLAPQRTVISWRTRRFFYFGLRVPPRCTASLWVASLGTRIQCGGTLSPLPTGRDSLAEFYYLGLMPPRCTASLWVASLGTRIQCGGTLSPLPTGRDSLGIGAEVQWNGLTVLLELLLLGGLQTHCCRQSSQEDCAAVQRHCDTNHRKGCTAYWEFGTIRCQQQDQPAGMYEYR